MTFSGEHYVCEKHKEERYYSDVNQGWVCADCEIENLH